MKFVVLTNQYSVPSIICRKYPYFLSKKNVEIVDCMESTGGRIMKILTINLKTLIELDELIRECGGRIEYYHSNNIRRPLLPVIYLN